MESNKTPEKTTLKISGKTLSNVSVKKLNSTNANVVFSDSDFEDADLSYSLSGEQEVSGYGKMFSTSAARALISPYWNSLAKTNLLDTEKLEQIVATEIGKEMLMLILSQKGCEGIRFYKAKRLCNCSPIGADPEADTIVAVGMDEFGNDLGVPKSLNVEAKNGLNDPMSIMSLPANKDLSYGYCSECSPPPYGKKYTDIQTSSTPSLNDKGLFNTFLNLSRNQ